MKKIPETKFTKVTLENKLCTISLDRPDKRNALSFELIKELRGLLSFFSKNKNLCSCILINSSSRDFCSGADLDDLKARNTLAKRSQFFSELGNLFLDMHKTPQALVAAVRGNVIAGGLGLACASDITISSEKANFALPEIKIGLVPMVVMAPIERSIGRKATINLTLMAESISAAEALRIGLVSNVFSDLAFDESVRKIATTLAMRDINILAQAKKALYQVSEQGYKKTIIQYAKIGAKISLGLCKR